MRTIVTRPFDFDSGVDRGHADALAPAEWNLAFSDETTVVPRR